MKPYYVTHRQATHKREAAIMNTINLVLSILLAVGLITFSAFASVLAATQAPLLVTIAASGIVISRALFAAID